MKYLLVPLFLLSISLTVQSQNKRYKLVWQDEFEKNGAPDPKNWTFEHGFVRNEEAQWYQPDNATIEDGYLIIRAKREKKANPDYDPKSKNWKKRREYSEYTSSSLLTRGLHDWKYGRFEMRAKIDTSPGMWPAFWTLGVSEPWPVCGEIDIMEYYRGMILANAAWAGEGWNTRWDSFTKKLEAFNNPDWADEFHVWRMDWDEKSIRLYVDDELLNTIELSATINERGNLKNPMKQPHYIIINLAIGGTNGGNPSATKFPKEYVIDYVRVYQ